MLAGLSLAAVAGLFVLWAFYTRKGAYGSDWETFYDAAVRWQAGQRIYTVPAGFFNPPPVLLLMRAFILLPYLTSRVLWGALSTAMLLAAGALTASAMRQRFSPVEYAAGAWLILFSVPTVLLAPLTGNFSAPVLLSYALSLWLFRRGHEGRAGAVLALTLVKPQLALLPLPLLLYKRRWRAAGGYLGAALAAGLLSLLVLGPGVFADYWRVQRAVAGWTRTNDAMQLDVPGIHGLIMQHWPQSTAADLAGNLLGLALIGALAWFWRGPWRPASARFADGWALLVLVTLLVASFAHSYDQVLLILPAVVLVARRREAAIRWPYTATLLALYWAPLLVLLFRQHFAVPAMLAACALLGDTVQHRGAEGTETRREDGDEIIWGTRTARDVTSN
jgi:hypothetical protein